MQYRIGQTANPPFFCILWLREDRLVAVSLLQFRAFSHRPSLTRMTSRICLVAAFVAVSVLVCGAASAASDPQPAVLPALPEPMTFYVVKGAPDSCGRGCDSWIEAEGQIVSSTAGRFKVFFDQVQDRNLPIYLASPGGNLGQAIVMGTILHAKSTIARVGRTLVRECGFEAQDSDVCVRLKQSGRELHGDLFTGGATCASACPFVFAGAAVHEVAPDAVLAVHSPKILFKPRAVEMEPSAMVAAEERGVDRADRMVAVYLAKVGIDAGLLEVIKTVRNEDIHVLTREEIDRFGFDRREFVETPWTFENDKLSIMHKVAVVRKPGETSFRLLQWRVVCFDTDRFVLDFQRPIPAEGLASVSIAHSGASAVYFNGPTRGPSIERWNMGLIRSRLDALVNHSEIEIIEKSVAADGRLAPRAIKLSNEGWAGAIKTLLVSCPLSKGDLMIQMSSQAFRSGDTAAK
jgi:hypothetical protein